jgi:hypothetical protein
VNHEEVIDVLAKAAAFDNRKVGEVDVLAWHEVIGRYEAGEALQAVTRHYGETRDRLMPADLIRHIKAIREDRRRRAQHSAPLALPSRFEDDEERSLRIKEGVAHCKDVLQPVFDMLAEKRRQRLEADPAEEAS